MPGGGVGTRTLLLSSKHSVDHAQMSTTLQRFGVTYAGARAFAEGSPVESPGDRKALASMFADALAQLGNR